MSEALTKEQTRQRVQALFDLAGQRHLAAGGDPQRSASCNHYLSQEEQQELRTLLSSLSQPEPSSH